MIKLAENEFNADLSESWFIGDTTIDVKTGINAGMHTIMLRSGDPKKDKFDVKPDFTADDLLAAVKKILFDGTAE